MVLKKTLESSLNSQEIKPVNPKGNQARIFIGRTVTKAPVPIIWPLDAKELIHWKRPWDAGKDRRQKEKGVAGDEMVR